MKRFALGMFSILLSGSCTLLTAARCGNGIIEETKEECDGGADCDENCKLIVITAVCGNGVIEGGETCDDSNTAAGDGCDAVCQVEPVCGNGLVEAGEQCEDGNNATNDACIDCQDATCGDGFVQLGVETCDDNNVNCVDCQLQCQSPAECADNDACTTGEDCVNGGCVNVAVDPNDNDPCTSDSCDPVNGVINTTQGDGFVCSTTPQNICLAGNCAASVCGDGFTDATIGEQCDDGNNSDTDACPDQNGTCQNAFCGDGFIDVGAESCDDSNANGNDGCSSQCQLEADIFVDCSLAPAGDGSLASPFKSLQTAIDGSSAGDVIMILSNCTGSFLIDNKEITIQGLADTSVQATPPTVNGGTAPAFIVQGSNSNIETVIKNLTIRANTNDGAVKLLEKPRLALINVDISNPNTGTNSAAVVNASPNGAAGDNFLLIDQSLIHDNGTNGVVADVKGRIVVTNTLINNTPTALKNIASGGDLSIINAVFLTINNASTSIANCDNTGGSIIKLNSSIIANSSVTALDADCSFTKNDFFNSTDGTIPATNIAQDPKFTTINGVPFHLQGNSPCLGAADPTLLNGFILDPIAIFGFDVLSHDAEGQPRPATNQDMGMFEN